MNNSDSSRCAECGKRTDFCKNGKIIKHRVKITSIKMKKYFSLKKIDINNFQYVCRSCYKVLLDKINNSPILDHAENISLMEKLQITKEDPGINYDFVQNKITMTNERCKSLTGIDLENFNDLFGYIVSLWPYQISQRDSLIFFLARLRLGKLA